MKKSIYFLSIALCTQIYAMEQPENNSPQVYKRSNLMVMHQAKKINDLTNSLKQHTTHTIELFMQKMQNNDTSPKMYAHIQAQLAESKRITNELISCLQQFPQTGGDLNKKIYTPEAISSMRETYEIELDLLNAKIDLLHAEEDIRTKDVSYPIEQAQNNLATAYTRIQNMPESEHKMQLALKHQSMSNLYLLLSINK